jgi:signal transduction histidine kinase
LILNAVKYTRNGGITVTWGDSEIGDFKRWCLTIADTGPGFHTTSGQPIAAALDPVHDPSSPAQTIVAQSASAQGAAHGKSDRARSLQGEPGEGIGLSIVKRLCELLDATVEMESVIDRGTTFRILFPRHYSS